VERVAVLSFDNLSGDESLAWMTDAVPTAVAAELAGVDGVLPMRADTSREASAIAATQLIHGYFNRRKGALHFEVTREDVATRKMTPLAVDGDALRAAEAIAKAVNPGAKPFSTQNIGAMEAWGRKDFEKATLMDPDFGAAWRDRIQSHVAEPALALDLARKALSRTSLRSPLERAQISLLSAQLHQDAEGVRKAGMELAQLVPNDSELVRKLAESETNARHFAQAVEFYQTILKLEPEDFAVYNALGYAQFFAGDLTAARKSFEEYGRHPGQEANALDSEGEALFMAGQFAEAEKYFLRAHEANPNMLEGSDLMKAAYARWLSGDLKSADGIFEKYLKYRSDRADKTVNWRLAGWEYATGRQVQAMDRLERETGPAAGMAKGQLQVLRAQEKMFEGMMRDLAGLEQRYLQTARASDGLVRVLYAKALLTAGKKAEAGALMKLWPLPESGEPALQPLLYPMYLELKKELGK
jgi:tetratricopeptide (TPR) repeat protein